MSEHEKDLAFLRQCIFYDDTDERRKLEERIAQVKRDERCVQRAAWLMARGILKQKRKESGVSSRQWATVSAEGVA